jgi:hypothetical protein
VYGQAIRQFLIVVGEITLCGTSKHFIFTPVCLVEDNVLNAIELEAHLHAEVDKATRSGDDNVLKNNLDIESGTPRKKKIITHIVKYDNVGNSIRLI